MAHSRPQQRVTNERPAQTCRRALRAEAVVVYRRTRGSYEIDYDYCKGCGLCAVECDSTQSTG